MKLQTIIDKGLALGLSEIEVYATDVMQKTIKVQNGSLDTLTTKDIVSYAIRGKYQNKMGYCYVENISDSDVEKIINKIILNASTITASEEEILFDGNATYPVVESKKADFDNYTNFEKIELLKKIESGIKAVDNRIVMVSPCQFIESRTKTHIVNSKGLDVEKELSYMYILAGAMASDQGENAMGYHLSVGFEFTGLKVDELIKETAKKAIQSLGATSIKTGAYPVIFHHEPASEILQAFSGIFSSEAALKKMTKLVGKEGEKLFGDNITIVDNPFDQNAAINSSFDDEGVPCEITEIVKNGVFNTFLYNLKTAKHFNKKSTGNGFKTSAGSSITVTNTNLSLTKGTETVDELISSVEKGVYVTDITGLHAGLDPISGDFNVQSSGFLIENGQLTKPITLFVISGNFFEMMNNVEKIANDVEQNYLDVTSPAIKIKSLMISGQ